MTDLFKPHIAMLLSKFFQRISREKLFTLQGFQRDLNFHFQLNFRDIEAVAVSAFHFFNKLPKLKEYMDYFGLRDDVNVFARHVFNGEMLFGHPQEYDQEWKEYVAANPNLQVECKRFLQRFPLIDLKGFKYEDVLSNKADNIKRLAKFLNVENPDIDKIIENTSVKKTLENRQKAYKAAGKSLSDIQELSVCYREGKKESWKDVLTAETLACLNKKS